MYIKIQVSGPFISSTDFEWVLCSRSWNVNGLRIFKSCSARLLINYLISFLISAHNKVLGNIHVHAEIPGSPMAVSILTNIDFHPGRYSGCILIRLFYITVIILQGEICNAHICNRHQYIKGSKFESNLKAVFKNLVQHTSQTGFNTSVYGQSPDQIYGMLQCRGDTTVDQCYNCSQLVTNNITHFCGNAVGAWVLLDFCYLRYENYSFIGQMGDDQTDTVPHANVTDPLVFIQVLDTLLSNLSVEAVSVMKRCAFGMTVDSLHRKIYALAQSTRDISTDDCTTCLSNTINYILAVYPGSQGVQAFVVSCIVRYDINKFFNLAAIPPPPPKHIAPPSKYNSPQINHSRKTPIILRVVDGFLLVLFVCLLWFLLPKTPILALGCHMHMQWYLLLNHLLLWLEFYLTLMLPLLTWYPGNASIFLLRSISVSASAMGIFYALFTRCHFIVYLWIYLILRSSMHAIIDVYIFHLKDSMYFLTSKKIDVLSFELTLPFWLISFISMIFVSQKVVLRPLTSRWDELMLNLTYKFY